MHIPSQEVRTLGASFDKAALVYCTLFVHDGALLASKRVKKKKCMKNVPISLYREYARCRVAVCLGSSNNISRYRRQSQKKPTCNPPRPLGNISASLRLAAHRPLLSALPVGRRLFFLALTSLQESPIIFFSLGEKEARRRRPAGPGLIWIAPKRHQTWLAPQDAITTRHRFLTG